MEALKDGQLVRKHHNTFNFRISCAEGVRYRVQRIGGEDGRTIRCLSQYVSRTHCEIFRRDKAFWIKDLGSSNGTYLNGVKLTPNHERELRFGDIVGMGISHIASDEAIDVTHPDCFIFTFEKEDADLEVVDLDEDEESKNVSSMEKEKSDSDEDVQIVEEITSPSSVSASNTSISPKKAMPPPPPPPIISKSSLAAAALNSISSKQKQNEVKATTKDSSSLSCSKLASLGLDQKAPLIISRNSNNISPSVSPLDVKTKRPSHADECQPPAKRSKQDRANSNSSSDDSSDGLDMEQDEMVNIRKPKSNTYSEVSSDDNSSEESNNEPIWTNISTKNQDNAFQQKIQPSARMKSRNSYDTNYEDDPEVLTLTDEDNEDVMRRKYDELKVDSFRHIIKKDVRVKIPQIIVHSNGRYTLTKEIYEALEPSCRRRMQAQFRESLNRNSSADVSIQQSDVTTSLARGSSDVNAGNMSPGTSTSPPSEYKNKNITNSFERKLSEEKSDRNRMGIEVEENHNSSVSSRMPETPTNRKSNIGPRSIQLLDDAPLPRFAARAQTKFAHLKHPAPHLVSKTIKIANSANSSPTLASSPQLERSFQSLSKDEQAIVRNQRLKEIELKKQKEREEHSLVTATRAPQPAKIKVTTRNRNQGLMESIIDSKSKSNTEIDHTSNAPLNEPEVTCSNPPEKQENIPGFNPLDPRLTSKTSRVIPHDPRLKRTSIEDNSSNLGKLNISIPPTSNIQVKSSASASSLSSTSKLKPGAEIIKSPPIGIGKVVYKEREKNFSISNTKQTPYPPAVSEDDIYKRILIWRPAWLEEQKTMKEDPPILKSKEILTTTLINYESYDAYFKIYYHLLLSEIWACISSDAANKSRSNDADSRNKRTEYKIKVDDVRRERRCPLVKRRKATDNLAEDADWVNVKYHTCAKRAFDIDHRKDFVILTLQGNEKSSGKKIEKRIFGFPLGGSDKYDLINITQDCDGRLRGKDEEVKFTEIIVCKFGGNFEVDKSNLGHVTRICNITPKLREFKALNNLRSFRLHKKIINPYEDPNNSWQSWVNKNHSSTSHEMISTCRQLNLQQQAIVKYVSTKVSSEEPELMLMHGPPGTGKTTTIVALVLQLLLDHQKKIPSKNHRILICTPSNAAIDEIMRKLSYEIGRLPKNTGVKQINMLRIGDGYASELKKYAIDSKVEEMDEDKSTAKSIKAELEAVENDIQEIKHQISALKAQGNPNPIALDSKLSQLKEKEARKKTLKNDYFTVTNKSKPSKDESQIKRSHVITNTQIICSTLSASSTSIMKAFVNNLPSGEKSFLCCIIDEASQTTEPETLLPLALQVDKLLLVGDPHQLGATVLSNNADEKKYGQSLFSRHFEFHNRNKASSPVMALKQQYRMHPEIVKWPNIYFYDSLLQTIYTPKKSYPLRPYYFLNLSGRESAKEGQIENVDEVIMVKALVDTIDEMLLPLKCKWTIGIITPYSAQRSSIRNAFTNKTYKSFANFHIDTVDGFQGQERDIIILSCVRTDATGFLKSRNRLNVALTRARHSLYIIGDARCLSQEDMWRCLIQDAAKHNNKFDVNYNFKNDLKMLRVQLCNRLKNENKT